MGQIQLPKKLLDLLLDILSLVVLPVVCGYWLPTTSFWNEFYSITSFIGDWSEVIILVLLGALLLVFVEGERYEEGEPFMDEEGTVYTRSQGVPPDVAGIIMSILVSAIAFFVGIFIRVTF